MAYKPVQNESAHLTDKPGRSSFKHKKGRKGKTETAHMDKNAPYTKSPPGKTKS